MKKRTPEEFRVYNRERRARLRAEKGYKKWPPPPAVLCTNCGEWQAASYIYTHEKKCFAETRNAQKGRT